MTNWDTTSDEENAMQFVTLNCCVAILLSVLAGCQEIAKMSPNASWHTKCGWKAEEYFDNPQVIALCKAIEANDLPQIDRLLAGGADVNTKGKGNMTPLLWAFPDDQLPRFKRLLEHGADPNVAITSDMNSRGAMLPGDSVTHMACATSFPGYFEAVFENGGDPSLVKNGIISNETPLFSVIKGSAPNKEVKVKLLLDKGADIDHVDGAWATPARLAVGWGGQYGLALMLLEAGADHRIYPPKDNSRLIHRVIEEESRLRRCTPDQKQDYQVLLKWLIDHGESIEEARADMARWESWSITTGEYNRKMAQEVAARKRREAREKQKKAVEQRADVPDK
jgi:hypothetical protein